MKRHHRNLIIAIVILTICIFFIPSPDQQIYAKDSPRMITIIYTTDTLGYLEPCGCGGRKWGGLSKRASYIKSVLAENPECVIVESGNLAYRSVLSKPTAQLETVVQALKYMGYTATGVGSIDVSFENEFYDVLKSNELPVLNIDESQHDWAQSYLIKDVNGVKIGVISFGAVEPGRKYKLSDFKLRYQAFKEARQLSDVLVVMDQAGLVTDDWLLRNVNRLGTPDIVITENTGKNSTESRWVGNTMIVPASKQGMYVGRIDIEITGNGKKSTFSRIAMDESISDDKAVLEMVESYKAEQRRQMQLQVISNNQAEQSQIVLNQKTLTTEQCEGIQSEAVSDNHSKKSFTATNTVIKISPIETGGAYYNYQTCVSCHESKYIDWKQTRHAKALDTLVNANETIADCLPCHSESYRRTTSVITDPTLMLGVECASCHYDILPHGADNKKKCDTEAIKTRCNNCHTKERSPNFDLATAYNKVNHKK